VSHLGLILLISLITGCSRPASRIQAHARGADLQGLHELPVYIDLRFASSPGAREELTAWFTTHGFQHASAAFDPRGRKVSEAFTYKDLVEASIAEIGAQTWINVYGILGEDEALRRSLDGMVRHVTSTRRMEHKQVKLP
jgi:hypothetical protein